METYKRTNFGELEPGHTYVIVGPGFQPERKMVFAWYSSLELPTFVYQEGKNVVITSFNLKLDERVKTAKCYEVTDPEDKSVEISEMKPGEYYRILGNNLDSMLKLVHFIGENSEGYYRFNVLFPNPIRKTVQEIMISKEHLIGAWAV